MTYSQQSLFPIYLISL